MGKITEPLMIELEREAATTRRVLERITDQHLSFKPHEKSRSTGQLAMHVASIPGILTRIISRDAFDVAGAKSEIQPAKNNAELISTLDGNVGQAKKFLAELDDERAMAPWKMVRGETVIQTFPRAAAIRILMFNHWYHHRGELVVYLRLMNIPVPSVYGPSADEMPF